MKHYHLKVYFSNDINYWEKNYERKHSLLPLSPLIMCLLSPWQLESYLDGEGWEPKESAVTFCYKYFFFTLRISETFPGVRVTLVASRVEIPGLGLRKTFSIKYHWPGGKCKEWTLEADQGWLGGPGWPLVATWEEGEGDRTNLSQSNIGGSHGTGR